VEASVPDSNIIFVFGSNLAGRHGKGAALTAKKYYGAVRGKGVGFHGQSYAIPTKGFNMEVLPLNTIQVYVDKFIDFARNHREYTFQVTRVGCGLAGYKDEDIAPMFADVPMNVNLPEEWVAKLNNL
jgi:hypothetical protein